MMRLLLWARASEGRCRESRRAPALPLRIPGRALHGHVDELPDPVPSGLAFEASGAALCSTRTEWAAILQRYREGRRARVSNSRAMLEFTELFAARAAQQAEITRGESIGLTRLAWLHTGPSICRCRESRRGGGEMVASTTPSKLIYRRKRAGEGSNGFGARAVRPTLLSFAPARTSGKEKDG